MPMMLTPDMSPTMPYHKQPPTRKLHGHQHRIASKCGHDIHPSDSEHTPWCPACTLSQARAKLGAANDELVEEGGLHPPEHMRDGRWNSARRRYLIAKQRLDEVRKNDQMRFERETAWDDAHQRHIYLRSQAAVLPQHPSLCIVCDSMTSSYPTNMPDAPVAEYAAWWERSGALVADHVLARRTPPKPRNQKRKRAQTTGGDLRLRAIIQSERQDIQTLRIWRQFWRDQGRKETATRRIHALGGDIPHEFWQKPIGGLLSWWQHRLNEEDKRKKERVNRGNKFRPKPPRSSLSKSETTDDVPLDPETLETLLQKEQRKVAERALEIETRRVAEEVGYLYFVGGGIDGLEEWRKDYEISDGDLVVRHLDGENEGSQDGDGLQGAWDGMDIGD